MRARGGATEEEGPATEERKKTWSPRRPLCHAHRRAMELPHRRPRVIRERRGAEEKEGAAEEVEVVAGGIADWGMETGRRLGLGVGSECGWTGGWLLLFIGPDGPVGLLGHRASPWATLRRHDSCRAGLAWWAEIAALHSPTSCSCRPRPEIIVLGSCSCRVKLSCFEQIHGPHAFWPTIAAQGTFPLRI
jgi:hypothetical protein